jgi:serine/threonine protein kinase
MIAFLCPKCGAQLRVKPELAGTSGRCSRCGKVVEVPLEEVPGEPPLVKPSKAGGPSSTFESAGNPKAEDLACLSPPQGPGEIGRLGPYRVLEVLGSGGMGVVLRAEDTKLKRQVALKVLKRNQASVRTQRERFQREAVLAASLEHEHIVPVYHVDEVQVDGVGAVPYLAMKLLQGESLEERLNREGRLPPDEVLRIGREVALGLAAAHEKGLIHRDIKPANIWLEKEKDRVKIVDFGLARRPDEDTSITQSGFMVGTPAYMSPEQAEGEDLDRRSDLFSLGGVLYRMCTGELPFKGKNTMGMLVALATKSPTPPRELNPELPAALSGLVLNLLQKDRDDRPDSAAEVADALEEIARSPEPEPPPSDVEVVEEDVMEDVEVVEPPWRPPPRRYRTPASRQRRDRGKGARDENLWERRVMKLAWVAGIGVALLILFLIIRHRYLKHSEEHPAPPKAEGRRLKAESGRRLLLIPPSPFLLPPFQAAGRREAARRSWFRAAFFPSFRAWTGRDGHCRDRRA